MAIASASNSARPRLWMVFAAVGLLAFGLLLAGLSWVRVYDDQLIQKAEGELIGQAVVVAEAYAAALRPLAGREQGVPVTAPWPFDTSPDGLRPILPTLRASSPRLPPAEDPPGAEAPADPAARKAGEALAPVLQRVRRSTLSGLRVVDARGVLVASSGTGLGASYLGRDEVVRALRGEPNSSLRRRLRDPGDAPLASLSRDAGVRVSVAIPVIEDGRVWGAVLASRTPMTPAKALFADRWYLAASALVLLAVMGIVSLAAAALIGRPLRDVVRQARAIAGTGPPAQIATPAIHELAQLSASLSTMAAELRDRSDYIRTFAASVSHEFKTPLASIQGAAELLRDGVDSMPREQRDKFLANIDRDARRLTGLVRRLLELARADAAERSPDEADLAGVLRAVAERAGAQLGDVPRVRVRAPAAALESVVLQLIENARQHGGRAVRVSAKADGAVATIEVSDDGPGISEANRARIFEPFFTTARDRGGTGLGLAIARSLLRPFGGSLELAAAQPTTFVIMLRIAS